MSQVTPAFQKFVASKLDELLELEDVEVLESSSESNIQKIAGAQLGVKLTKRSRLDVDTEEADDLSVLRQRPSLLSHREPQVHLTTNATRGNCCNRSNKPKKHR